MPHVCGDEPDDTERIDPVAAVCPTYVGMNRVAIRLFIDSLRMPHVCGDEPKSSAGIGLLIRYTPHAWG